MIDDLELYIEELKNACIERDLDEMEEIWKCVNMTYRNIYLEIEQLRAYKDDDEVEE